MKKPLIITVLIGMLMFVSVIARGTGRGAILIGIDKYDQEQQIAPLRSASSDARKLGQVLSQNGYNCQVMVDENATKEKITEAFIQMQQQTSQADELELFLVYFSGRGTRISDDIQADEIQDGLDECILPSDAKADNARSHIRDDALARWISAVHAKQVILILDCAFWGDEGNPNIKGLGALAGGQTLDGIEIVDGLPQDIIIISAGSPGARVVDGVFTAKFLESLVTEEADGDGDRKISFGEAYQFAQRQLKDQQPPKLFGSRASDIPLAPLPPKSKLQIKSDPPLAQVLLYKDSQELKLKETHRTPAMIPLTKGTYEVQVQKKGFLIPETKEAMIIEYNSLYDVNVFQLESIKVVGQVGVTGGSGKPVSVTDGTLTVHIDKDGKETHQEALPADGKFHLASDNNDWLEVGSEYEIRVTGKSVLSSDAASFTYDGYTDVNTAVKVTLDDIPPALSARGVTLQAARLVAGEKIQGQVHAKDDGLGLADAVIVKLQPPDDAEIISVPASGISFQPPGTYEFSHVIPDEQAPAGEWSVAAIALEDKAGNKTGLSGDQLNAKFHVFASRFALGKYHFDSEDYDKALDQLKQISAPDDDAHYFTALSHYHLDNQDDALAAFQKVKDKSRYLGRDRAGELPKMPRKIVNKIWGGLLKNLKANREDASYMEFLAITAEELGRAYEAKTYRSHAERLRKAKK